jgi:hypothetical protein
MIVPSLKISRRARVALTVASVLALSACTSIGYRCPLDPHERPDSPTACAGMQEAMAGARLGTGGKTSVLVDDAGRLVPPEVLSGQPARPLGGGALALTRGVQGPSGEPVFHQPQVFQSWASAFVDANGNLHDGHNAWFATPGRWDTGSVDAPTSIGATIMSPAIPTQRPEGLVVPTDKKGNPIIAGQAHAQATPALTADEQKARTQAKTNQSLRALGQAALSQQRAAQPQAAPGITAPAVGLGH